MQNLPTVEPIETAEKKETAINPQEPSIKQSQVFRPKSVPQTEQTQMVANNPRYHSRDSHGINGN